MEQYIYTDKDGELVASLNPEYKNFIRKLKYDFYLKESNIPVDYYDLQFEHVDFGNNSRPVSICRNYVQTLKESKLNLYLYGLNTTGKTTAACSIGKEAIRQGYKVRFVLSSELLDILQKTSGYNYNPELEIKKSDLMTSDLIIIDEVFDSTKSTIWKGESKNLIVALLDSFFRYIISMNKRLVLTSNIVKDRIANDYSISLFDLIDRNFQFLSFTESVKEFRKQSLV